ncbi:DpnD/PcfM family protein [Psychrobacter jeotgali]|uniref:DpnD/PcfM family protein n=1 Tax=Psychrobacter jeotgali TaxID=179010 RepID=UPI001918BA68|nr:DpnD/PcfM family protein [Psychrobacter jeotgali]
MTEKTGLKTYQIEIIETMSALIEVVAKDAGTAMLEAQERYRNEDIVLEADNFIDTKFIIFGVE